MLVELNWPPKELLPNNTSHWTKKAAKKKRYREDCSLLMLGTKPCVNFTVTFYPPDKRKRDRDSQIAAFKAGQDGIADAWGIDDNLFRVSYEFKEPVKYGKVVVSHEME